MTLSTLSMTLSDPEGPFICWKPF